MEQHPEHHQAHPQSHPQPHHSAHPHQTDKPTLKQTLKLEKIIEKLRRVEIQEFTNYLQSPFRILWANFLAGTARGLGFIFGASLVIALISFIFGKVLNQIPGVGEFFEAINVWIKETITNSSN